MFKKIYNPGPINNNINFLYQDPPTVLKPGDLTERGSREWKPRMGFTERRDQVRVVL